MFIIRCPCCGVRMEFFPVEFRFKCKRCGTLISADMMDSSVICKKNFSDDRMLCGEEF